jgi:hypothetical protein
VTQSHDAVFANLACAGCNGKISGNSLSALAITNQVTGSVTQVNTAS